MAQEIAFTHMVIDALQKRAPGRSRKQGERRSTRLMRRVRKPYPAKKPPSTGSTAPVMNDAADDARNKAAGDISSGEPVRLVGVRAMIPAIRSGVLCSTGMSGVSMKPGAIAFTRMPSSAHSTARALVNCTTAPFEAA